MEMVMAHGSSAKNVAEAYREAARSRQRVKRRGMLQAASGEIDAKKMAASAYHASTTRVR
jgi:hypothetical protein